MEPAAILAVARTAAHAATEIHARYLGQVAVPEWSTKGIADYVTRADREAENRIVALIREAFPHHGIMAEESAPVPSPDPAVPSAPPPESDRRTDAGGQRGSGHAGPSPGASGAGGLAAEADWLWIIDPLDGTTNFLHRYPMYAVSIAVQHAGDTVVAVVVNSVTGEEWTAVRGQGAFRNGEPLRVSTIADARHALIGTGFPFKVPGLLPEYLRQFDRVLRSTSGIRRAGSAALDLCHLANGYLDGFWELWLAPWDIAAGVLIVREAGGVATRVDGSAVSPAAGNLLAGNPAIYAALKGIVNAGAAAEAR